MNILFKILFHFEIILINSFNSFILLYMFYFQIYSSNTIENRKEIVYIIIHEKILF